MHSHEHLQRYNEKEVPEKYLKVIQTARVPKSTCQDCQHYVHEFIKYTNGTRKNCAIIKGIHITIHLNIQRISYFIRIRRLVASSIDTSRTNRIDHYPKSQF